MAEITPNWARKYNDNTAYPDANTAFDLPLFYDVRDKLLSKSEIGKKYIAFYYYFSCVYENKTDLTIDLKTLYTLLKLNSKFKNLLNPSVNSNLIFIDQNMRDEVVELIHNYQNIYTDEYNDALINNFIYDLDNLMLNKTVGEVANLFK